MNLVCVSSPKGGVGKTTLTANTAFALQRLGHQVVVIDFDNQNALRLHFGLALNDRRGYVAEAESCRDWRKLIVETDSGVGLLPYGATSPAQRERFDTLLSRDPEFLARRLGELFRLPGCVVLADLPPGPSPALTALSRLDPLRIAVLLADSASLSVLPQIESGSFFGSEARHRVFFIANQVDLRSRLNRDVTEFLQSRLGASLLGLVHRDEAVPESNASQMSVFAYAPASAFAYDLEGIARNISRLQPSAYAQSAMKYSLT